MKKPRTKRDVENDSRVTSIHSEDDGCYGGLAWWCYLKAGYQAYNNHQHIIHEKTIRDICGILNDVTEWGDDPDLNNQQHN